MRYEALRNFIKLNQPAGTLFHHPVGLQKLTKPISLLAKHKSREAQVPWEKSDGEDVDDQYDYGGRSEDDPADYSVGQFINKDDTEEEEDDSEEARTIQQTIQ